MRVRVLGSGTSQGVPVIACDCEVCQSTDPRDKRTRTSILIEHEGKNLVIDTGPDFRSQMLDANVQRMDAVLFTHEHKDHVAGLDDIRAFNFKQKMAMDVYATPRVQEALKREFQYVFEENPYPGVPSINLKQMPEKPFQLIGLDIIPVDVMHYKLPVKAFRINDFAYVTDANFIAEDQKEKLKNLDVLILTALRIEKHISHYNLEEAIEIVKELKPRKAYFTHISHLMGKQKNVEKLLPPNIHLCYDGLELELD